MAGRISTGPIYKLFDLTRYDISEVRISENSNKDHCYISDKSNMYEGFIISKKTKVQTICKVFIRKSKSQSKYVTHIEFRKQNLKRESILSRGEDIIVTFKEHNEIENFWKVVTFLQEYKELVDIGDFENHYSAVTHETFNKFYQQKKKSDKIESLLEMVSTADLDENDLKSIIFNQRKGKVKLFYALLKNVILDNGEEAHEWYRTNYSINIGGSEAIWHHFLKANQWIIGLNTELRFISEFHSEQKIGEENSKGSGSSKVDFLGTSYFITLVELKTENTKIFKNSKSSKSRANTFDFSPDFIEAYSQILGQNDDILKTRNKRIELTDGKALDRTRIRTIDPKCLLVIGTRNREFPHNDNTENNIKTDTFERFRRDSRKIEILTYDELFERAYHIVHSDTLEFNWYSLSKENFKKKYLK